MTRLRLAELAVIVAVLVPTAALSCQSSDGERRPSSATRLPEPDDALSEELMIALAQAKNFIHKAKVHVGDGNVPDAIASVHQILAIPFPAGAPEGEDVRLDARAFLAKLLAGQGKLDEAMQVVEDGIAEARRHSFFLANLWTVKGELYEARAKQLAGTPAAAEANRDAIRAFDQSITINAALQERLFKERP